MSGTGCSMSLTQRGELCMVSVWTACWSFWKALLHAMLHDCSVNLGEKGMEALITLGAGDMRRTLNILQVCRILNTLR